MRDDIIINKIEIIKRSIQRVEEEYQNTPQNLENFTKQDAIILNVQRVCEACIAMAFHCIKVNKWELPQESREGFKILEIHGAITSELSLSLQKMVEFRNIAVHNYQKLDRSIIQYVIECTLYDALKFSYVLLER
ncbi:MAG: DUF86 domain-containing protein [Fusobacteria bacterium]|nr:DUF86 domain-containing protein [Fusobacteriota bacterium]